MNIGNINAPMQDAFEDEIIYRGFAPVGHSEVPEGQSKILYSVARCIQQCCVFNGRNPNYPQWPVLTEDDKNRAASILTRLQDVLWKKLGTLEDLKSEDIALLRKHAVHCVPIPAFAVFMRALDAAESPSALPDTPPAPVGSDEGTQTVSDIDTASVKPDECIDEYTG